MKIPSKYEGTKNGLILLMKRTKEPQVRRGSTRERRRNGKEKTESYLPERHSDANERN